jgi:hypothetical protein
METIEWDEPHEWHEPHEWAVPHEWDEPHEGGKRASCKGICIVVFNRYRGDIVDRPLLCSGRFPNIIYVEGSHSGIGSHQWHGAGCSWNADDLITYQKSALHFMETEFLLPCLQDPKAEPYLGKKVTAIFVTSLQAYRVMKCQGPHVC